MCSYGNANLCNYLNNPRLKMKITISKTVEETHELELPAYRKNICYYYKIISEEKSIQICFAKDSESIGLSYTSTALNNTEEANEQEFNDKLNEVVEILKQKIG